MTAESREDQSFVKAPTPVALVTGAGRNLGRAIAVELARTGWDIALNVRSNRQAAEAVAHEVRALGRRALVVVADISDGPAVAQMYRRISCELGSVTTLVNNASPRSEAAIDDLTDSEWDTTLGVTLTGAFYCCRAVVPEMKAHRHGQIINILGAIAHVGQARRAHLAAAKSGLLGMTRALAIELGPFGITVNGISPGPLDTVPPPGLDPAIRLQRAANKPIARLGEVREVAAMVAYLASPAAAFVTGQAIGINGGEVMLG